MTSISSSFVMQSTLRKSLLDIQRQLGIAQQELSTGRYADLSLVAGADVGRGSILAQRLTDIRTLTETNKRVSARLETSHVALSSLRSSATDIREILLRSLTDGRSLDTITQQASQSLAALVTTMNSTLGSEYLFSGINIEAAPLLPFDTDPPSAAKVAIDEAFQAAFGMTQDDPNVSTITKSDMEAFLSGPLSDLFDEESWKNDWSSASDTTIKARISLFKTIDVSVTANDPALRNLAMGYSALSQLALERLSPETAKAVVQSALDRIDAGLGGITTLQAKIGGMQSDVDAESNTLAVQNDSLLLHINAIEGVDPTEAAVRINALTTQLETAYTMTAKLQQLSLTKYL